MLRGGVEKNSGHVCHRLSIPLPFHQLRPIDSRGPGHWRAPAGHHHVVTWFLTAASFCLLALCPVCPQPSPLCLQDISPSMTAYSSLHSVLQPGGAPECPPCFAMAPVPFVFFSWTSKSAFPSLASLSASSQTHTSS